MSDLPPELDLKFLPDWLKEGSSGNRYANYQGDTEQQPRRDDRDRGSRDRRAGPPKQRGGKPDPRRDRRESPPRGDQRRETPAERRTFQARPPAAPEAPKVTVEFLPEPNCVVSIAKQIKSSGRAYPLFGTARLFLEKPERHRVRITSLDPAAPLFQIEDGPVSFDRAVVERNAFRQLGPDYYKEEVVQGEPIKGNFTNVARCRATGTYLGPTNYHSYQPALRKLYEERFSRRMPFGEFQQQEIEIVTSEQAINDWKEQARASTTLTTIKEAEPLTFKSASDAEQHFRQHYLPPLVRSGSRLEASGAASRAGDRSISATLRETWERERAFPANLVNHLRQAFIEAGLHFFKHRKRILYISPIRPQRHAAGQVFSEGIAAILAAVESTPKITRPQLAKKLLGEQRDAEEMLSRKAALAADLHYLIHVGHVIEFHDATLDLPLGPKGETELPSSSKAHVRARAIDAEKAAVGTTAAHGEIIAPLADAEREPALIGETAAPAEQLVPLDAGAASMPEPTGVIESLRAETNPESQFATDVTVAPAAGEGEAAVTAGDMAGSPPLEQ